MKNITISIFLFCFAGIFSASSQIPSYVPQNGLVSWWPFNGNANDESGNGNNCTVAGPTLVNDRNGIPSSAYSFDGINDYIISSGGTQYKQPVMSFSFWLKSNSDGDVISIGSPAQGFDTQIGQIEGYYNGSYVSGFGYGHCSKMYISGSFSTQGVWDHYVFIADTVTDSLSIYRNGIQVVSTLLYSINTVNVCNSIANLFMGYPYVFAMQLDDVGIWNRALSSQEIFNLFIGTSNPNCNPLPSNVNNGLLAYYPFCGNANDESGNGHSGIMNGTVSANDRFGNTNQAFSLPSLNDNITVNNPSPIFNGNSQTISTWFKLPAQYNNSTLTLVSNGIPYSSGFFIALDQNNAVYGTNNYSVSYCIGSGSPVNFITNQSELGQWNNIIAVYDGSFLKLYLNGQLKSSQPYSGGVISTNGNLFIADWNNPTPPTVTGRLIDDVAIWNRALSQVEINQVYAQNLCFQTITVTDTLLINVNLSSLNPVTFQNTIKVFPNPTHDHITIDFGANYASLNGYTLRIDNTVGQTVFTTPVQQNSVYVNLNSWTGTGLYFVYLLDNQGHVVDVRKIVLQ